MEAFCRKEIPVGIVCIYFCKQLIAIIQGKTERASIILISKTQIANHTGLVRDFKLLAACKPGKIGNLGVLTRQNGRLIGGFLIAHARYNMQPGCKIERGHKIGGLCFFLCGIINPLVAGLNTAEVDEPVNKCSRKLKFREADQRIVRVMACNHDVAPILNKKSTPSATCVHMDAQSCTTPICIEMSLFACRLIWVALIPIKAIAPARLFCLLCKS